MRVAVLGAAGQLGREVVQALLQCGQAVRAIVRRPPKPGFPSSVEVQLVDANEVDKLSAALKDQDAVVNAIGARSLRKNTIASTAARSAVVAAERAGVRRFIAISAGMVDMRWPIFKYLLRPLIFRNVVAEHGRVEAIVRASDLLWTIVRPSRLTNEPGAGYTVTAQLQGDSWSTSRSDLAAFIADEIQKNEWVRRIPFVTSRRKR